MGFVQTFKVPRGWISMGWWSSGCPSSNIKSICPELLFLTEYLQNKWNLHQQTQISVISTTEHANTIPSHSIESRSVPSNDWKPGWSLYCFDATYKKLSICRNGVSVISYHQYFPATYGSVTTKRVLQAEISPPVVRPALRSLSLNKLPLWAVGLSIG